ncbi:MAG TPA: hypothetical protein DCG54_07495 [Anaerolineae bacterium]|jgi:hypothetical protein|nr:hypothetical protein [Anaerolineae bacterium]
METTSKNKVDLNDLLIQWQAAEFDAETQAAKLQGMLVVAKPLVELLAEKAGSFAPKHKDDDWSTEYEDAITDLVELTSQLDEKTLGMWRSKLARKAGLSVRDFNNALAGNKRDAKKKKDDIPEIPTFGGWFRDGDSLYFVDYWLDYENKSGYLVWRDPNGNIKSGKELVLNNNGSRFRLIPFEPDEEPIIMPAIGQDSASVVMPPGCHNEPVDLANVLTEVIDFMRQQYLFDEERTPFIIGLQIVNSWVYENFRTLAYLRAIGDKGSGKSELMRRAGHLCYRLTKVSGGDTESVFFRITDMMRGTIFIEEADMEKSAASNNIVKFFNMGAMDGNYVNRTEEWINPRTGVKAFRTRAFACFCPKIFSMRGEFQDDAVASRSLDIRLIGKSSQELVDAGIELEMGSKYWAGWRRLMPKLLRLRMQMMESQKIDMDMSLIDTFISPRYNQVTMPAKIMAKKSGNERLVSQIRDMLREKYLEETAEKSMETEARIVEALWKMYIYADMRARLVINDSGEILVKIGDVTAIANNIIEEMKQEGQDLRNNKDDPEKKGKKTYEVGTQRVGRIMKEIIQLRKLPQRTNKGFFCIWDDIKMEIAGKKYGVLPDEETIKKAREEMAKLRAKVDLKRAPLQMTIDDTPAEEPEDEKQYPW